MPLSDRFKDSLSGASTAGCHDRNPAQATGWRAPLVWGGASL